MTNATAQLTLSLHDITVHAGVYHHGLAWAVAMPAGWRCVEEGVRRAATTTRPAWTPRVWRRA